MLKRHEVEILLKAGHAKAEIARLSGVSLRSVKRIAEESPVLAIDDEAERTWRPRFWIASSSVDVLSTWMVPRQGPDISTCRRPCLLRPSVPEFPEFACQNFRNPHLLGMTLRVKGLGHAFKLVKAVTAAGASKFLNPSARDA